MFLLDQMKNRWKGFTALISSQESFLRYFTQNSLKARIYNVYSRLGSKTEEKFILDKTAEKVFCRVFWAFWVLLSFSRIFNPAVYFGTTSAFRIKTWKDFDENPGQTKNAWDFFFSFAEESYFSFSKTKQRQIRRKIRWPFLELLNLIER